MSGEGQAEVRELIPAALAGERVDRVVALLTGLSRSDAAALVAAGDVDVNGQPCRAKAARLDEGDEVALRWEPVPDEDTVAPDPSVVVAVVYEDPDVIVVDKPPGLVVHPGAGHRAGTLVHGLLARYPELGAVGQPDRPGIVHRLDRDTSGLLMVARSQDAYESLVAQLAARQVERRYATLAWGRFAVASGTVDAPIGRSAREPTRLTVSERGRPAITHYRVERAYDDPVAVTLLHCRLETGRTHQIRVHLEAIGHPVVGDERYGGRRQSLPVPRLFLHAAELGFRHPRSAEPLSFTSPLPDDLSSVLAGLEH